MMRVAITVLSVSLVVGVRLDDDIAADPSTTAAASSSSQAAQEDMAAKSAVSSFANLMKDTSAPDTIPEVPYSFKRYMLPTEEKYPDCVTEPETHADIMGQLEADVNRELDRPAVGLASDVGSEAGRLAIGAGYAPEKVACVAAKMVLAVGGSNAESKQTGDLAQTEAQTASQIDAKAEEMVVTKRDAAAEEDLLNVADKLNAAAEVTAPETMRAATMVTKAGASSDSEAESQQIADDFKKAKDASMQVSFSSPVAASSIPSTASSSISSGAAAIIAEASQQAESTRASSSSAAFSLSEAGAKDKKKSSTAEAFDAIKKLADSLLPGAKAAKK